MAESRIWDWEGPSRAPYWLRKSGEAWGEGSRPYWGQVLRGADWAVLLPEKK